MAACIIGFNSTSSKVQIMLAGTDYVESNKHEFSEVQTLKCPLQLILLNSVGELKCITCACDSFICSAP